MTPNPKVPNLLQVIQDCVQHRAIRLTRHAEQRMLERDVSLLEVLHVLRSGWHEARKDTFHEDFQSWVYAVRSQASEDRSIRIAVSIDEPARVIVITVIDLDQ